MTWADSAPDEVVVLVRRGDDVFGVRFENPRIEIEESCGTHPLYDGVAGPGSREDVVTVRGIASWVKDSLLPKLGQKQ